jgi:hypothetical protein
MSETASLNGVRKPPEGAPRGFPPVIDLGLCIARSGNPTFADRQITLVASPRNQISQFLSFALDEFNFFIPSDSVLQAARAKLVLRSVRGARPVGAVRIDVERPRRGLRRPLSRS